MLDYGVLTPNDLISNHCPICQTMLVGVGHLGPLYANQRTNAHCALCIGALASQIIAQPQSSTRNSHNAQDYHDVFEVAHGKWSTAKLSDAGGPACPN